MGITWTNIGNTPATYVRPFNCDTIIRDDVVTPAFNCTLSENAAPPITLGPRQGHTVIGPIIKESDLEGTKDESKAIYIFGYVTYRDNIEIDPYNLPEDRITRFCQRIIQPQQFADGKPLPPQKPPVISAYGCDYACSDKTCPK